jgi:hypothetical protein
LTVDNFSPDRQHPITVIVTDARKNRVVTQGRGRSVSLEWRTDDPDDTYDVSVRYHGPGTIRFVGYSNLPLEVGTPTAVADKEAEQDPKEVNKQSEKARHVAAIGLANKLLDHGLENSKAAAIATAIIMQVDNGDLPRRGGSEAPGIRPLIGRFRKEALARASKTRTANLFRELLDRAEEESHAVTGGDYGLPARFHARVSRGQLQQLGEGISCVGQGVLAVRHMSPDNLYPLHVEVTNTRTRQVVAQGRGRSVNLEWVAPEKETYPITVRYNGPDTVDVVGYAN